MNPVRSAYDEFWDEVQNSPDPRVQAILPTKGRRYGDLTGDEKRQHTEAVEILRSRKRPARG